MFGKEQPDVVTEEEVGEYIEQLKKAGLVEIDYAELEQRVTVSLSKEQRNLQQCASYIQMYGSSPTQLCKELGIKGTVTGRLKGGSTNELARLSEDSTSGTQVKK